MLLTIRPHTIIMLIGDDPSKKAAFLNNELLPALQFEDSKTGLKLQTTIFNECNSFDFWDELSSVISFPQNHEFIIINDEQLDKKNRSQLQILSKNNMYKMLPIFFETSVDKKSARRNDQLILAQLSKEQYPMIYRHVSKKKTTIEIADLELYKRAYLPLDENHIYLTDVHECLEELKSLIKAHGFKINNDKIIESDSPKKTKFVLMGDYVDKGGETKAIINFLFENQSYFHFIVGNHENFVYKLLSGLIDGTQISPETQRKYFTSIKAIEEDLELHKKLNVLFEQAVPFTKYMGNGRVPMIYATHAPCRNKYLGKVHPFARARQRSFRIDRTQEIEGQIDFIKEEADAFDPYHLFGHVMTAEYIYEKNKIGIDTGCVAGNALTSVVFTDGKPKFTQVTALSKREKVELPILFKRK